MTRLPAPLPIPQLDKIREAISLPEPVHSIIQMFSFSIRPCKSDLVPTNPGEVTFFFFPPPFAVSIAAHVARLRP
jgi:hypothetical protein